MATTDARPGFRLPWSPEHRPTDDRPDGAVTATADVSVTDADVPEAPASEDHEGSANDAVATVQSTEGETMIETAAAPAVEPGPGSAHAPSAAAPDAHASGRKPSKFLADLTRAMQSAAEAAREESLVRVQADAKVHVEEIHTRSATEAADLRRRADDDVAEIREWSKAEIARIREETEARIAARKDRLESEIEEHAALIERQIERVQARVASFEEEMARFFEQLLGEEDPTRFASLAANLPEPPPFDLDARDAAAGMGAPATHDAATAPTAMIGEADDTPDTPSSSDEITYEPVADPEAAMAAIQAAAEAAAAAEEADAAVGETGDAAAADPDAAEAAPSGEAVDPRLSALGLAAGFAEAEAEALAAASTAEDVEIPTIANEALAARLAGLVPPDDASGTATVRSTQVVVTGLVSVASIASFKRHLGRLPAVQAVGVSSGPDGEFVFTVTHGDELSLREAVPTLPGFGARVTGGTDDRIDVTAKDPESDA